MEPAESYCALIEELKSSKSGFAISSSSGFLERGNTAALTGARTGLNFKTIRSLALSSS